MLRKLWNFLNDGNLYDVTKDHDLNNSLGKFSVYQDAMDLELFYDPIINDNKFPTIDKILENKEDLKLNIILMKRCFIHLIKSINC